MCASGAQPEGGDERSEIVQWTISAKNARPVAGPGGCARTGTLGPGPALTVARFPEISERCEDQPSRAQGPFKQSGGLFEEAAIGPRADRRDVRPWARSPVGRAARGPGLWAPVQPCRCVFGKKPQIAAAVGFQSRRYGCARTDTLAPGPTLTVAAETQTSELSGFPPASACRPAPPRLIRRPQHKGIACAF
jgi:hypothetical protein